MSGRDKAAEARQKQYEEQQAKLAAEQTAAANTRIAKMDELQKPSIDFYTGITSGDSTKMLQSLSPQLSQLAKSTAAAKQNIFENVAEGPARDFAIGKLSRESTAAQSTLINENFMNALGKLFEFGGMQGEFGMGQYGLSQGASSNAASINDRIQANSRAAAAAKIAAIAQLGGMAGNLAMGGFTSGFGTNKTSAGGMKIPSGKRNYFGDGTD